MRIEDKVEGEKEVTRLFAAVCPLGIDVNSILSEDPPRPDIYCDTDREGPIHLELVEILERETMARTSGAVNLQDEMEQLVDALSAEDQGLLEAAVGNASIGVDFQERPIRSKRKALSAILKAVTPLAPDYEGELLLDDGAITLTVLRRPGLSGPSFSFPESGWIGCPDEMPVLRKFEKEHETIAPLGLLAYFRWHPVTAARKREFAERLVPELRRHLAESNKFQWLWIADLARDPVLLATVG